MLGVLATVLLVGCNSMTVGEQTKTRTDSISDDVITEATDNINTWDNTEVYFTRTKADYDAMTDVLENRNGKIIIEVIETTVSDDEGNMYIPFE